MSAGKLKKTLSTQNIIWLVLFVAGVLFVLWKCPFGFGGSDEAFYLTIPHRLCLGDQLFQDEWHLSQLTSFFTYPFVNIYRHIVGSNDGIMLSARYTYALIHCALAALLYIRTKKFGFMAVPISLIFMLYSPFDIMAYSYNTIAIDMLAFTVAMLSDTEKLRPLPIALAGMSYACAVICCPYLAVSYFLYLFAVIISLIYHKVKNKEQSFDMLTLRFFVTFTMGVGLIFLAFAAFFFIHSGIGQVYGSIWGIFMDPEHPKKTLWLMLKEYVYSILFCHDYFVIFLSVFIFELIIIAFDKGRKNHKGIYVAISSIITIIAYSMFFKGLASSNYNAIMFPLVFIGLTAYILLENKPKHIFCATYVLGTIYSLCVSSTSNMRFLVITMAFSVVNIGSMIFIGLFIKENKNTISGKVSISLSLAAVTLLSAMVVYVKAQHCSWDSKPGELCFEIGEGPAKGIKTREDLYNCYNNVYNDLQYYKDKKRDALLMYTRVTWCELIADDFPYSGYSAWLSGLSPITTERLELYYRINPSKYPHYIYILKDGAFDTANLNIEAIYRDAEKYGFSVEENNISLKLEKIQ